MKRFAIWQRAAVLVGASTLATAAFATQPLTIRTLAEKNVSELPSGELFWRIDRFGSLGQAEAAAGRWSLATVSAGKAWLFTVAPAGSESVGGEKVAEVGPIPRVAAKSYLLRINDASGSPGSVTTVHSHPGSEAFYVLSGEQSIRSADGVERVEAGQAAPGHGAGTAMQVSSSGSTDLHALVMFVVDADKPFSSPASLP